MTRTHMGIEELFDLIAGIINETDDIGMPPEYTPSHRRRLAQHFANTLKGLDARFNEAAFLERAAPLSRPGGGTMSGEKVGLNLSCSMCKKTFRIEVRRDGYIRWAMGELIQNVLPELSDNERELMISGICGPCFDDLFAEEEADA